MTELKSQPTRRQLLDDGFCVFPQVLDREMLQELTRATQALLAAYPAEDAQKFRYQGSNISLGYQDPVFPRLFAWPEALQALAELGFDDPRWWSAFLLSKPPYAPPLYWHQDWWAWGDPVSASEIPPQVFLMYYLTDTTPTNGCLRVIPGTHRRRIPLHDQLPDAHTDQTYTASLDTNSPLFATHPDEVDVPVKAGDLVIGDARLLHAAHANNTGETRSCLTLWYLPAYSTLPASIRAFAAKGKTAPPGGFDSNPEYAVMARLAPDYVDDVPPPVWNRTPGEYLRP